MTETVYTEMQIAEVNMSPRSRSYEEAMDRHTILYGASLTKGATCRNIC